MTEELRAGLAGRSLGRIALFGTRFTVEARMFGQPSGFDVARPAAAEIARVHDIYLAIVEAGASTPPQVEGLRHIERGGGPRRDGAVAGRGRSERGLPYSRLRGPARRRDRPTTGMADHLQLRKMRPPPRHQPLSRPRNAPICIRPTRPWPHVRGSKNSCNPLREVFADHCHDPGSMAGGPGPSRPDEQASKRYQPGRKQPKHG